MAALVTQYTLTLDGRVDMEPRASEIRHCTWAECPGIEASVPILEGEHGYHHAICRAAMNEPFTVPMERFRQVVLALREMTDRYPEVR